MPLSQGGAHEQGGKRRAPPLKRHYFTGIGSFSVKMVADRHRNATCHNKHWLLRNVNIDDLEWPWTRKI